MANAESFRAKDEEEVLGLCPLDVRRVFEDMLEKGEETRPNTGGL